MDFTNELLEDVSANLLDEHRALAGFIKKREKYPEQAHILDPLIEKIKDMCGHLEKLKTDLRMSAVASRT